MFERLAVLNSLMDLLEQWLVSFCSSKKCYFTEVIIGCCSLKYLVGKEQDIVVNFVSDTVSV